MADLELLVKLDPRFEKLVNNIRSLGKAKISHQVMSYLVAHIIQHVIKNESAAENRGVLAMAAEILGVNLRKYLSNTERVPGLKTPLDKDEMSRGLQKRTYMQGNRLRVDISPANSERLRLDIMNDKKFNEIEALIQKLLEEGIK